MVQNNCVLYQSCFYSEIYSSIKYITAVIDYMILYHIEIDSDIMGSVIQD